MGGNYESQEALTKAKAKGTSAKDNVIAKIEEERQEMLNTYTFGRHWDVRERQRDFDAKMARGERLARNCGSYLTDQKAMCLSQQMFDIVDKLKARWELFGVIRHNFPSLIDKVLDKRNEDLLKEAEPDTMVNILCQSFQMLTRSQIMEASIRSGSSLQFCKHVWDFKLPYVSCSMFSCAWPMSSCCSPPFKVGLFDFFFFPSPPSSSSCPPIRGVRVHYGSKK